MLLVFLWISFLRKVVVFYVRGIFRKNTSCSHHVCSFTVKCRRIFFLSRSPSNLPFKGVTFLLQCSSFIFQLCNFFCRICHNSVFSFFEMPLLSLEMELRRSLARSFHQYDHRLTRYRLMMRSYFHCVAFPREFSSGSVNGEPSPLPQSFFLLILFWTGSMSLRNRLFIVYALSPETLDHLVFSFLCILFVSGRLFFPLSV